MITYDLELSIFNIKSICNFNTVCHSYFLSPVKIYVLTKLSSTGSKYSEYFTPMILCCLEQVSDLDNMSVSVKHTFMAGVKFHKPILFFQSKVHSLVMDTSKRNIEKVSCKFELNFI